MRGEAPLRKFALIACIIVAALQCVSLQAASGKVDFGHTFGGFGNEVAVSIDTDGSGNIYIFGHTGPLNSPPENAILAKFDSRGEFLWQRLLNFSVPVFAADMVVDPAGNLFLVAGAENPTSGSFGTIVAKVNTGGGLAFARFAGEIAYPNRVATDPLTGGVVLTGLGSGGEGHGVIASLDLNGTLRWSRVAGALASPLGVDVDDSGSVYVSLNRLSGSAIIPGDIAIAKLSSSGVPIDQRRLDLPGEQYAWDLRLDAASNAYVVADDKLSGDAILTKVNSSLLPQWTEHAGSPSYGENPSRAVLLADGTFFALGMGFNSRGEAGIASLHLDPGGALLAEDRFESQGPGGTYSIADATVQVDGSILIAGASYGSPPRDSTPVGDASVSAIAAPWVGDAVSWNSIDLGLSDVPVLVSDPGFSVDDFRWAAWSQAWFGATLAPPPTLLAQASYTIPDVTNDPRNVQFTSNASGGTPPYTYRWSFADGTFDTTPNPVHRYERGGRYPVQLFVNDTLGSRGYGTLEVVAEPSFESPPDAIFVVSPEVGKSTTIFIVDASATTDIQDPAPEITVRWDWEDDGVWDTSWSTTKIQTHRYTIPGRYTIRLQARDTIGLDDQTTSNVVVDDRYPSLAISLSGTLGSDGWYVSPVSVQINASDDLSGVADVSYRLDGGAVQRYSPPLLVEPDGIHVIEFTASDIAGNTAPWLSAQIRIDTTAPISVVSMDGVLGANGWWTTDVAARVSAVDITSGVASIAYRIDGSPWRPYVSPVLIGEDVHVLEYRAEDNAGLVEIVHSREIRVDTHAPILSDPSPSGTVTISTVTISWSGFDSTSGIQEYQVSLDDGPFMTVGIQSNLTLMLSDGEHSVVVRALDSAGNVNESRTLIRVDTNVFSPTGPYFGAPTYAILLAAALTAYLVVRHAKMRRNRPPAR